MAQLEENRNFHLHKSLVVSYHSAATDCTCEHFHSENNNLTFENFQIQERVSPNVLFYFGTPKHFFVCCVVCD